MKFRYILLIAQLVIAVNINAQIRYRHVKTHGMDSLSHFVRAYTDSLLIYEDNVDSAYASKGVLSDAKGDYYRLFTPIIFYRDISKNQLCIGSDYSSVQDEEQDKALLSLYLTRPDLVIGKSSQLDIVGPPIVSQPSKVKPKSDLVDKVAQKPLEPDAMPVNVLVKRPNFWGYHGDYYLQFLQNYVSGNWYKGGESSYSMVGSVILQANYNNKQKVKWDNKLEMKLGFQNTKGDTLHSIKTSEDLLRYTGKLGLQASKKWYYTVQLIASTQFLRGYRSNDTYVYSDIFSPLNLNLSVGMDYNLNWFKNHLNGNVHIAPLAYNYRYVGRGYLATRYGLDDGDHHMEDYGSEFTIDMTWRVSDMISWRTRIYGYTTYKRAEFECENTIQFKFNKYISSNIFIYPRFDDGVSPDDHHGYWQYKEYASVGFSYSL